MAKHFVDKTASCLLQIGDALDLSAISSVETGYEGVACRADLILGFEEFEGTLGRRRWLSVAELKVRVGGHQTAACGYNMGHYND